MLRSSLLHLFSPTVTIPVGLNADILQLPRNITVIGKTQSNRPRQSFAVCRTMRRTRHALPMRR